MAKYDRRPSGTKGNGGQVTPRPPKVAAGSTLRPAAARPSGKAGSSKAGRQSVAAARRTKPGSNRTQLIIGVVAVVVIAIVVVIGLVLNKKQTATQADGYGPSTNSTAALSSAGVVTVNNGTTPPVVIDAYEDALCPSCQAFEQQFGQQINQLVDTGKLEVRYHMVTFLDAGSHSKNYSTRASAALMCVAADSAAPKGTFLKYLENLYASDTKPEENGSSDLSDQQLADLAVKNGATATTSTCITSQKYLAQATATDKSAQAEMTTATGSVQTPTVLQNGKAVDINSTTWLTNLVG